MTGTRTSRIIDAPPQKLWRAFLEADALLAWLPPRPMTGRLHAFDPRVGGGYRLSLFYPEGEQRFRGKSAEREDRGSVRFLDMHPCSRLVQAVTFETDDPAFHGEMRMAISFEPLPLARASGTEVVIQCTDLPPGLRPEDNDAGTRISLDQLADWARRTA